MKLTTDLKNKLAYASSVHPCMYFREGNVIRTRANGGVCLVKMTIDQEIPTDFFLIDLKNFMNTTSLLSDADIKFIGTGTDPDNLGHMEITNNQAKIRYGFTPTTLVESNASRHDKLQDFIPPNIEWSAKIKIDSTEIDNIQKVSKVMGLDTVCFTESGIKMYDSKIESSSSQVPFEIKYNNSFTHGANTPDSFDVRFLADYMNLYTGSYEMELVKMGNNAFLARFDNLDDTGVTIWLSATPSSKG